MNRRGAWMLTAATGAAALTAGLWSAQRRDPEDAVAADKSIWDQRFEQPDGGTLAMAGLRGRVLVLNFWATWCPPCIEELPEFARLHRERSGRGVQVVGLAIDKADPVKRFLAAHPVGFPIGVAGFDGLELTRRLGNSSGAMPFTVLFDRNGQQRRHKLGQTDFAELARWIDELPA